MANRSISSSSASFYERRHEASEESTMKLYALMRMNMTETQRLMKEVESRFETMRPDFGRVTALVSTIQAKKATSAEEEASAERTAS